MSRVTKLQKLHRAGGIEKKDARWRLNQAKSRRIRRQQGAHIWDWEPRTKPTSRDRRGRRGRPRWLAFGDYHCLNDDLVDAMRYARGAALGSMGIAKIFLVGDIVGGTTLPRDVYALTRDFGRV